MAVVSGGQGARAIDITDRAGIVRIAEAYDQVGGQVMALLPGGSEHVIDGFMDSRVAFKAAEGWADVPYAVFPPDGQEPVVVAFIKAVAVVGR